MSESGFVHVFAPPDEGPVADDALVCSDERPFHESMRGTYAVIYHPQCLSNVLGVWHCPCCQESTLTQKDTVQ